MSAHIPHDECRMRCGGLSRSGSVYVRIENQIDDAIKSTRRGLRRRHQSQIIYIIFERRAMKNDMAYLDTRCRELWWWCCCCCIVVGEEVMKFAKRKFSCEEGTDVGEGLARIPLGTRNLNCVGGKNLSRKSGTATNSQRPRQHLTTTDTMGESSVVAPSWRQVEVGRVIHFGSGPYAGRIAAIVQIIDHKRVRSHHLNTQGCKR